MIVKAEEIREGDEVNVFGKFWSVAESDATPEKFGNVVVWLSGVDRHFNPEHPIEVNR